jgi:hypothetical protein
MNDAGIPQSVAMMVSGHKSPEVFRRYAITNDDSIRRASARLGEFMGK